jgi:rSAM/selenodomain-associated transferase 2
MQQGHRQSQIINRKFPNRKSKIENLKSRMSSCTTIIPALDEERVIERAIESARGLGEVIVVDGGSSDRTVERAIAAGARVIDARRGRGIQLAAGASAAESEWLLFLHADSRLTRGACHALADAIGDPTFQVGTFRLRLDSPHPIYRIYSWFSRFDSIWTSFGDQGILIRRDFYHAIGGFPAWDLLEDVNLLQRARALGGVRTLNAEVETSSRRFERNGIIRQQLRNFTILLRYLRGADPNSLARLYLHGSEGRPSVDELPHEPAPLPSSPADGWHIS